MSKSIMTIPMRLSRISDELSVKRILPYRERRMVGPFIFLDHMGPTSLPTNGSGNVLSHPHIGLSTVSYLFSGSLHHRDSLGYDQIIQPGDVNWMTAGRGIVHAELAPKNLKENNLHGLQAWVALPIQDEDTEPSFEHYPKSTLPIFEVGKVKIHLIAGEAFDHRSPVKTHSKLFYFIADLPAGESISFNPGALEAGAYLVEGEVDAEGTNYSENIMITWSSDELTFKAKRNSKIAFLGGAPLSEPRHIYWNFVSSSKEKIEKAKLDWKERRFPSVPGETAFVPLPEK